MIPPQNSSSAVKTIYEEIGKISFTFHDEYHDKYDVVKTCHLEEVLQKLLPDIHKEMIQEIKIKFEQKQKGTFTAGDVLELLSN